QHGGQMTKNHVVRLGGPARPHDVHRIAAEKTGELLARALQRGVRPRAEPMRAGGIADELLRRLEPGLFRLRQQRRGGVVIEVEHDAEKMTPATPGDEEFQALWAAFQGWVK